MRKILILKNIFSIHGTDVAFLGDYFWVYNKEGRSIFSTGTNR